MKNKNLALLCCALAAVVVSVDISPEAYTALVAKGSNVWISNVYYT